MPRLPLFAALLSSGLALGCAPSSPPAPSGSESEAAAKSAPVEAPEAAVEPKATPPVESAKTPIFDEELIATWRSRLAGRDLKQERPDLARAIADAAPQRGRDGQPRLSADWLDDPDAGPLLLARLLDSEDRDQQVAVAWALAHGRGAPVEALVDLATEAREPAVRSVVTAELYRHDAAPVVEALAAAMGDDDVRVRTAAVTASGRHPQGKSLIPALVGALADEAPEVRWVAARSISAVGEQADAATLEPALDDAHPRVRRVALRALARLDATRAKALVAAKNLTEDPDPAVARTAASIARP